MKPSSSRLLLFFKKWGFLPCKAISTTRKNLIAVVNSSAKSVIEKWKPKDCFFFGNPKSEVNARFNQDYVESHSKSSSSSSSSSGFKQGEFDAFSTGRFQHNKRISTHFRVFSYSPSSSEQFDIRKSSFSRCLRPKA